ncbi:caspase family protein [Maliponia aquimaris]|uniref:Caspase domain protein n=1 Tax=Maliponia aquimaris TaxID=1673631 RepID=A0A238L4Q9_9RHOB|nr:caspase family protein [Maliponia aquimaris]SMX50009.1 Caspase domain protein [Maliponia aquimaris]
MRINDGLAALCAAALLFASWAEAATHGLVVGVSDYAIYEPYSAATSVGLSYDLLGAANDAARIAQAMRAAGIALPEDRLLLDSAATKDAFLAAWESMLRDASPGDTLIVTFAGHGGQEREAAEPWDEADRRDEMIMFHDFDPDTPGVGRLNDDELNALFRAAEAYDIVWVADSCHSGGLERSAGRTLSRFGGLFDGLPDPALAAVPLDAGDEGDAAADATTLDHVTQILATASESFLVEEVQIEGEMHGALSWYFAEALSGGADADGDGVTTRAELSAFLDVRIFARMNQTQQPRILPRGDDRVFLGSASADTAPGPAPAAPPATDTRVPVTVIGPPPPGLDSGRVRLVELGASLVFEATAEGRWEVRNGTGDRITDIDVSGDPNALFYGLPESAAPLVARTEALQSLTDMAATATDAPRLRLRSGGALMHLGDRVWLRFENDSQALPYLTLFNLASSGEVQFLHPAGDDGRMLSNVFDLDFNVVRPVGTDVLVALACPTPPRDLHALLDAAHGQPVSPALIEALSFSPCKLSITGLYTSE